MFKVREIREIRRVAKVIILKVDLLRKIIKILVLLMNRIAQRWYRYWSIIKR